LAIFSNFYKKKDENLLCGGTCGKWINERVGAQSYTIEGEKKIRG